MEEGGSDPTASLNFDSSPMLEGTAFNQTPALYDYDQYIPCGYYAFDEPEVEASQFLRKYVFPIILFVGLLWNPLTAAAFYYIGVHKWSTVFYLSLLSVVDLLILLIRCGDSWYAQIARRSLSNQIMNASDALCKTYNFVFMFMKHMSPWLVVAVSMELMISTRWPRRTYVVCTMERARNVVMLLVILIFCLDINHFWTWGVPRKDVGCRYTEEFSTEFRDMIWPALTNTVELLLPLIFVSVCFFITAATMIGRKSQDEKNIEEELTKYFMELKTLKDFQVICLIISLSFMCLTIFKIILNIVDFMFVKEHLELDCEGKSKFNLSMQLLKTLDMVFTFLFYTLKVVPCFVYSSTFRQTLLDGFGWCKRMLLRLVGKLSGRSRKNSMKLRTGSSKLGGNGGGIISGRGSVGGNAGGQQMKPLVTNSNSHVQMEAVDDFPLDSGRNRSMRTLRGDNNDCVNGVAVAAVEDNQGIDDSRRSFLGVGTDV